MVRSSAGESFGTLLRRLRLARGMTQEALAHQAMMSPTAVAALERGRNRAPRLSTLGQLARALELDPSERAELARAASREHDDRPVPAGSSRSSLSRPPAAARRWRTDFVGRAAERELLRQALATGRRLVEVVGESGIGKTRLVTEVLRDIPDGTTVLWGRCSQDRLGSYLPFVEALRYVVARADPPSLRAAVGVRGDLTRLVPELVEQLGDLPAPARAEAGSEQRMLFEAVASFLAYWSPVILIVEDLHWADDATLALVAYLLRDQTSPGLAIIVTARSSELGPMASGLIAEVGREVDIARIHLDGLGGADLELLISDLVGTAAPSGLVKTVAAATEGNPFFVEEMTLHLVDSGHMASFRGAGVQVDMQAAGVPDRVRETVVRRLLSLSADAVELLSVGAVIGREFELSVASASSGLDGNRLVDAADDAVLSGMVVETGPGRLTFSHALVREAVNSRMTYTRQATIHRRVSEAIERRWPANPSIAAELARHWSAVAQIDPTAAVAAATWAVRAGDVALAAAAAEEAIARYEEASALWAQASVDYVDALIRLGAALQYGGRPDEADARFREAIQLASALREPTLQARAAIGLGRRYPYWETDGARIEALETALAALRGDEQSLRVVLMGLLVTHLITGFEPEQAHRRDTLAQELRAVAASTETAPGLLLALGQIRIYDCIEDPVALSRVAGRLLHSAQAHNDLRVEAGARFAQALASLDIGDMGGVSSASAGYGEAAEHLGDPRERSQAATVRSTIAFIEGRYEEAARLADEALRLGQTSGDFNAELVHYAQGLLRAVDQGLAGEVLPLLLATTEYDQIASFDAGTALCAALAGDRQEARSRLRRLLAEGFQGAPRGADWLAPTAFLAHTCHLVGTKRQASGLYRALEHVPVKVVRVGPLAGWWGPVDHHLGLLARQAGRPVEAERHLRQALEIEQEMGARPFQARTLAGLSTLLRDRDPRMAAAAAEEALVLAGDIGAAGILAEVKGEVS
jgi:transcriptional regulator with XRE-family HTH domain/tetratricopeptide (TPR) repeat protein